MKKPEPAKPITEEKILQERRRRIASPKTFVFLLISLALMVYLVRKIEFAKTIEVLQRSNPYLIIGGCFIYFISNFFKALRFRFLLKDARIGLPVMYVISSYHNFFNQILPARTGELTLVYYLKKIGGLDISRGFHSLLVARIFDFIIISAFFVCSTILYFGRQLSLALFFIGILFLAISIMALFNLKWLVRIMNTAFMLLANALKIKNKPIVKKISSKIDDIAEVFRLFDTKKHIPALAITSILVWVALYSLFYVTMVALGINIDITQSVVGSTGGVLANVLPINSFGSFGTLEAGWSGGFVLVGIPLHEAIISGFAYHLISFTASAFIALLSSLMLRIFSKRYTEQKLNPPGKS